MPAIVGCAVGNIGTLAGKVSHFEGTSLIELYSIGLHIRTRSDDSGLHFGFSERDYYLLENNKKIQGGWYLFCVPFPNSESVAQNLTTYGMDISLMSPESGISLGYQQTIFHYRVSPWSSFYIEYQDNKPQVYKLIQK